MTDLTQMLAWARWYHERGMHPMPLQPAVIGDDRSGKRPLLASWEEFKTRQPTLEEITTWWTQWPDANIGLIQGRGQFVLDIDGAEGEAALAAAGVEVPRDTPEVKTGKGRHLYFQGNLPKNSVNVKSKFDTRTDGGYVVAPPSSHYSGVNYTWTCDLWPPPKAPAALMHLLLPPTPQGIKPQAESWLTEALAGVDQGSRDVTCARIAGYLWGKGLPEEVVEAFLQNWGETCTPPFPSKEITKTVLSICKREGGPQEAPETISAVIGHTLGSILAPPKDRPPVASTGLGSLDKLLDGGIYPGDYVLMASRPSVGKSALAQQMARESAGRGAGALIVTLEMTTHAITRRLLVQESGIPMSVLKTGEGLTAISSQALVAAAGRLEKLPIWITTGVESGEGLHEVLATFEPGVLSLVIVDYLQLMSAEGRDGRARVEHCSKMVKRAATKFNVPVVCLCSLSRPPRDFTNWRPELRDLRESGELEHDADIVIMLHRELGQDLTEIFLRKHREGRVDANPILASFDGARQNFREKTL